MNDIDMFIQVRKPPNLGGFPQGQSEESMKDEWTRRDGEEGLNRGQQTRGKRDRRREGHIGDGTKAEWTRPNTNEGLEGAQRAEGKEEERERTGEQGARSRGKIEQRQGRTEEN